jgi:hypothetical protein
VLPFWGAQAQRGAAAAADQRFAAAPCAPTPPQGPDRKGRGVTVFIGANHLPRCAEGSWGPCGRRRPSVATGGAPRHRTAASSGLHPQPSNLARSLRGPAAASAAGGAHSPPSPLPAPPHPRPSPSDLDAAETQRFISYACDATVAIADPELNPLGKTTGVFCMGGFGLRNFDVMGAIGIARAVQARRARAAVARAEKGGGRAGVWGAPLPGGPASGAPGCGGGRKRPLLRWGAWAGAFTRALRLNWRSPPGPTKPRSHPV